MLHSNSETPQGASNTQPPWQNLFEQHINILREHLTLWNTVRGQQPPGSDKHSTAQECFRNTQEMIKNFENLQTSFVGEDQLQKPEVVINTKHALITDSNDTLPTTDGTDPTQGVSRPSKRQRTEKDTFPPVVAPNVQPVKDISDLFSIDITPTPIEQLQASKGSKKAKKELKRKLSQSGLHPIGLPEPLHEVEPIQKRSKQFSTPGTIRPEAEVLGDEARNDPEDEDSFVAKVQQKLTEKGVKRQRKLDKKRKRESNTSLEDHTNGNAKSTRPNKKKQRQEDQPAGAQIQPDMGKQTNGAGTQNKAVSSKSSKPNKRKK